MNYLFFVVSVLVLTSAVKAAGGTEELVSRVERNARRLEAEKYTPDRVFLTDEQSGGWPGDTEGRTVLALVLEEAALGKKARHLDEIVRRIPAHLNERGYMGTVRTDGVIDEQQLSGNGWMLRALCAYARYEREPVLDVRPIVRKLARNLFLPCRGRFASYPIDPGSRAGGGGASGSIVSGTRDGWRLSTDVGCAFIGLDGLVDAHRLTSDAELVPVIEEMIARFLEIDLVAIKAQTHASLTALRALLRHDARRFLPEVEKRFDLYVRYGMTDRYENYNWFCRYDTWTEPCAIVDSLLLAHQLHELTGKPGYADFERRFLDALVAHQRDNGGFGLQKTYPKGSAHGPEQAEYEAHWCCTMRGGAGLASALLWRQEADCAPETWFHIIGGNASKEGLAADIAAIKAAGIGGIQFFHGHADGSLWPGVREPIPCLSEKWADLVKFAESECHRQGLSFKMQNCPGWSMSGGPWIDLDHCMRKLVCFEPGKMPQWDRDDDYHEIGTVTFPYDLPADGLVRTVCVPCPSKVDHNWCYEPGSVWTLTVGDKVVLERPSPRGVWQDEELISFAVEPFATNGLPVKLTVRTPHWTSDKFAPVLSTERRLDNWEGKAGRVLREFTMSEDATPIVCTGRKTLVFGHVNAKRRNHPAPPEGTGWECDKMDPAGFTANFNGYLGKLMRSGVKVDGTLVDSWECWSQSWTPKMESEFRRMNGYELRPWLPALFGYVLRSEAETERFLLDWRRTCSRLIEDNYYGTMARLAHENGMTVQFETAFGDVLSGDPLRFWKYADEPMCEFWSPFDNDRGFVGSHDFKAVRPCVSAAHLYGKRRVSAEAFTSFDLTFDENMQMWKENANRHFDRGVTHLVFHTYTHNPVVDGLPPGSSFGGDIGSPFLRLQTWWPYMPGFTAYLADCCRALESGKPVVDILRYLGDALSHRPSEQRTLFGNRYKYDYLNADVLTNGLDVADGRLTLSDGMSYRVLWIPDGTFLLPETETRIAELERKGARIVRGELRPDWEPQLSGGDVFWYERRTDEGPFYFIAAKERGFRGRLRLRDLGGEVALDLVRGESRIVRRDELKAAPRHVAAEAEIGGWSLPLGAWKDLEGNAESRAFSGTRSSVARVRRPQEKGRLELDLGRVCHWATVFVNGREAARLWCEPYRCDITDFLKDGENEIRVDVTSTWFNQLVYDAALPEKDRRTWTVSGPKAGMPLRDSGLIGPVRLRRFAP